MFAPGPSAFVRLHATIVRLEAAVVNTLSPGDKVLAVTVGNFGDRFADMTQAYGADVIRLEFEWGTTADPDTVKGALAQHRDLKAVMASTSSRAPSTIRRVRSTSPPKSAWPGVSTMLIL